MEKERYLAQKDYFNQNLNISYIEENLPKANNDLIFKHYLASLLVYGFVVLLIHINPFYVNFTEDVVKNIFFYFYACYMFIAPIIYFIFRPKSLWKSHNIEIINYIKKFLFHVPHLKNLSPELIKQELEFYKPTYYQQQSLMLIFIKFFFGVFMLQWLYNNLQIIVEILPTIETFIHKLITDINALNLNGITQLFYEYREFLYKNSILILYSMDLMIFGFGYLTELNILNNKIRTVETTPAGIFFCIACYGPFCNITRDYIGWNQNDYLTILNAPDSVITWTLRLISLIFLVIYVSASIALGTKASNLTNRGTVTCFPYNIVRHPAYVSKNTFWILTTLPVFIVDVSANNFNLIEYLNKIFFAIIVIIAWAAIYYFRALTEERHLIKDPDYQQYVEKVKYRFIPKII